MSELGDQRVVVIGGGLAGLAAAHALGGEVPLCESSTRLGGLCASRRVPLPGDSGERAYTFDYTGHLLHFKTEPIKQLVHGLLADSLRFYHRKAVVRINDREIDYPFQASLYQLPEAARRECLEGFLDVAGSSPPASSFDAWIRARFGEGIARQFMIPYNQKLWQYPLELMSCGWVDALVPQPHPDEIRRSAQGPPEREFGYNIDFAYPEGGIGQLASAFGRQLSDVRLATRLVAVDPRQRLLTFSDGTSERYDQLISSIPLPALIRMLDPCPAEVRALAGRLVHNSILNINYGVEGPPASDQHWIYLPDPDVGFYRVGFGSNFAPDAAPEGHHTMYVEVSYRGDNPYAGRFQQLTDRVERDLVRLGYLEDPSRIRVREVNDLRYAYVIYDLDYEEVSGSLHSYLESCGIHGVGRFGRWRYYSMEEAMICGRNAAAKLRAATS